MARVPGWYDDPACPGTGSYRYFDGEDWTFNVSSSPTSSPAGLPPVVPEPTPRISPAARRSALRYRRNRRVVVLVSVLALGSAVGFTQLRGAEPPPAGGVPVAAPAPVDVPSMPTDEPVSALPSPAPSPPSVTGGPTRAEFAAAASRACSATAATVAGFDLKALEDRSASPGRLPHAVSGAYGLLAEELSALPKPPADEEVIEERFVAQVRLIARDTSMLAAEVDRVYATAGYDQSVVTLTNTSSPGIERAAQTMAQFEAEYGISCRNGA